MKKSNIYLSAGCIIICGMAIAFFVQSGEGNANTRITSDEFEKIERAIIIDGLKESEAITNDGKIIVCDDFLAESTTDVTQSENVKDNDTTTNTTGSTSDIIKELQARDKRWHVSPYTIRSGDNIWTVAKKFGTNNRSIIQVNNISNPDMLRPGRKILVPNRNGVSHTVKKGDSLSVIARYYKADPDSIKVINKLNSDRIRIGQTLFIPDGIQPVIRTRTVRATNSSRNTGTVASPAASRPQNSTKPVATQAQSPKPAGTTAVAKIFSWPLRGQLTSGFGQRRDPFTGQNVFHYGIDIGVVSGTPVKAAAPGRIIFGGWNGGYGNCVVIEHENGYISVYGHLSSINVALDQKVEKGQVIALSGNTGLSTGAHLHFEIRRHLTALNPLRLL